MNRPTLALSAPLVSSLVLGLAACRITVSGERGGPDVRLQEGAERVDVLPLELASGELVELDTDFGSVMVEVSDGPPELRATLRAHGRDVEEARAVLARYAVAIERTDDGARVTLEGEPLKVRSGSWESELTAVADFVARVPAGTRVDARSGFGDVETRGALGALVLETGFGDVRIDSSSGDVRAESGSGLVEAQRLEGGDARLESGFGDVRVGSASVRRLECTSGSGDVRVDSATAEELELDTRFGSVHVVRASGALSASSGSGDVRLHDVAGPVDARSGYGSVEVEGVLGELSAWSGSGDVRVRARAGSRVARPWKIESSYGDVVLEVPDGFACELDARTGFGEVRCALPLAVAAGGKRSESALEGELGGGGGEVTLASGSGDVVVKTNE